METRFRACILRVHHGPCNGSNSAAMTPHKRAECCSRTCTDVYGQTALGQTAFTSYTPRTYTRRVTLNAMSHYQYKKTTTSEEAQTAPPHCPSASTQHKNQRVPPQKLPQYHRRHVHDTVPETTKKSLPRLRQSKLPQLASCGVFLPHILRPEGASVHVVFKVVPNDVCLLQEQPHAVKPTRPNINQRGVRCGSQAQNTVGMQAVCL